MRYAAAINQSHRVVFGSILIFFSLLLIAGTWTIPFVFESSSMLYKFGFKKVFLRSGKIVGITAAMLLFFQVLLVSRFKILDRIYSLNRTHVLHRVNGIAIVMLVLLHPILIIAAEGFTLFPFEKRYWPEILGVVVFVMISGTVTVAAWRSFFGLAYHVWLRAHRFGTIIVIATTSIHILFVSETFQTGIPRALIIVTICLNILIIIRLWYRRFFPMKRKFIVSDVTLTGTDAHAIELKPDNTEIFQYLPGQFAFITPVSENIPKEEHPFTISSTPTRLDKLQFTIRSIGDWTSQIEGLQPGDPVFIDGPYGIFSYLAFSGNDPVIMIAGGIGITPVLSMLRFMADENDQRSILLIWSNKTSESIVLPETFEELRIRLKNFKIIHIITRPKDGGGRRIRLDQEKLDQLLRGYSRQSRVFICGPPAMMKHTSIALKTIGFKSARIHMEKFQF